jgi:hypothetical protein
MEASSTAALLSFPAEYVRGWLGWNDRLCLSACSQKYGRKKPLFFFSTRNKIVIMVVRPAFHFVDLESFIP